MRTRRSTVLVTGGLGYIGSYVVRDLLERGWQVRVLDNRYRCDPTTASELAALDGVEVVEGDIRYAHMVESATQGVEAVVHLAAVCMNKSIADPTESLDVNLMGTQNVLDAASRASVRRIVYASSASVYGNPTQLPMREDDKLAPITPYCVAKLAGEQMLDFYARRAKPLLAGPALLQRLRPGPADRCLLHLRGGHLPEPAGGRGGSGDRRPRRPVDGLRARHRRARAAWAWRWSREATGEVLNVGTGQQTSISDLADLLVRSLGSDAQPVFRPREVLVTRREAAIERIQEVLGWRPQVGLEEGIASVLDWHKRTLEGQLLDGAHAEPVEPAGLGGRRSRGRRGHLGRTVLPARRVRRPGHRPGMRPRRRGAGLHALDRGPLCHRSSRTRHRGRAPASSSGGSHGHRQRRLRGAAWA